MTRNELDDYIKEIKKQDPTQDQLLGIIRGMKLHLAKLTSTNKSLKKYYLSSVEELHVAKHKHARAKDKAYHRRKDVKRQKQRSLYV